MEVKVEKTVGIGRSWRQGRIEALTVENWDEERRIERNERNKVGRNEGMPGG